MSNLNALNRRLDRVEASVPHQDTEQDLTPELVSFLLPEEQPIFDRLNATYDGPLTRDDIANMTGEERRFLITLFERREHEQHKRTESPIR